MQVLPRSADAGVVTSVPAPPATTKPKPKPTHHDAGAQAPEASPACRACAPVRARARCACASTPPKGTKLKTHLRADRQGRALTAKGKRLTRKLRLGRQPVTPHTVIVVARTTKGETLRYEKRYGSCYVSR